MQITCPLVYNTLHEVLWAHSTSEDRISNRLEQEHSILMEDESSYCEFPYIWQHLAMLQHHLLKCLAALPAPLITGGCPLPLPWGSSTGQQTSTPGSAHGHCKCHGAGGKDEPWPLCWMLHKGQLTLSLGQWGWSIPNLAAFFVGVERETQGILSNCIQKGRL